MNAFGWAASVLGGIADEQVPGYISPAVADDVSNLPTTYIDAGSAEVSRDEDVAYATRMWAAGGQAELHVRAGGFRGFDALYPQAHISAEARRTRTGWLTRVLTPVPREAQEEASSDDVQVRQPVEVGVSRSLARPSRRFTDYRLLVGRKNRARECCVNVPQAALSPRGRGRSKDLGLLGLEITAELPPV
jgi:hypothetical protein